MKYFIALFEIISMTIFIVVFYPILLIISGVEDRKEQRKEFINYLENMKVGESIHLGTIYRNKESQDGR